MSARSLNKVLLIGNLTRDPELRYTPQGTAVTTFGIATNREWTDSSGQKQEGTEFHRLVAWGKLAEICSQLLTKGRKIFVEGRLQTRSWQATSGEERQATEVVIDEMIALDAKGMGGGSHMSGDAGEMYIPESVSDTTVSPEDEVFTAEQIVGEEKPAKKKAAKKEVDPNDEIPF